MTHSDMLLRWIFFTTLLLPATLQAQDFISSHKQTHLIELYSSQGCSSCPPAERWISRLKTSPRLWQDFIPVVFHVDYWNYLGWKDPFSQPAYSKRQRSYYRQGAIRSVYTPGFILTGEEWRGWIYKRSLAEASSAAGQLTAHLNNGQLKATYSAQQSLQLNAAILGFGVTTTIPRGENSGKTFTEDFIVLSHQVFNSANGQWNVKLDTVHLHNAKRIGIALWVNQPGNFSPLQATGGWISELTDIGH